MATVISMWFMLQADIEEAKELPEPPAPVITRMEFDMKDQNIRLTIQNTADDVAEIKEDIKRLEEKIDKLR
jgi:ubiquinone biosynthesis protein UbiJ